MYILYIHIYSEEGESESVSDRASEYVVEEVCVCVCVCIYIYSEERGRE